MKPAGQMTLSLTRELEDFVRVEVKRGAFASSSEYVRDLLRDRYLASKQRKEKLNSLDAALKKGIADAEAGRTEDIAVAFKRIRRELASEGGKSSA